MAKLNSSILVRDLFILFLVYSFFCSSSSFAISKTKHFQSSKETETALDSSKSLDSAKAESKYCIAVSVGFYELSALRIGYQINEEWGISIKGNFVSQGFFNTNHTYGRGIGLRVSRTFPQWLIFNNISVEPTYITKAYIDDGPDASGAILEINTGTEITNRKGIHFFWSAGYSWRFVEKEGAWNKFSFKLGMNYLF